jgi:ferredoxin
MILYITEIIFIEGELVMSNTIYWFSGTGNSLYATKVLAELIGDTDLVAIAKNIPTSDVVSSGGGRIGFVFPSYYGDLPRLVRAFVEKLNVPSGTDIFAVVTMGAFGQGSVKALAELLEGKGLALRYGVGLRMPANYIIKYDPATFGAKSDEKVIKKLRKIDNKLRKIANEINGGIQKVKVSSITKKTLYTDIAWLDSDFSVTEKCTGCGLCAQICPVSNIELKNERPIWLHHCEHCVACISWCPTAAIEYGQETKKRTRYHNPLVKPTELEIS